MRGYKTIAVDKEVHYLIRVEAAKSGMAIKDWVAEAVQEKVERKGERNGKDAS